MVWRDLRFARVDSGWIRSGIALAAVVSISVIAVAEAGDAGAPMTSAGKSVVHLKYQAEMPWSKDSWVSSERREVVFIKEPVFKRHHVFRAVLSAVNIPFAVDTTAGKLYLDLNRNFDLTDDPQGVYAGKSGVVGRDWLFTGVVVDAPEKGLTRRYEVTIKAYKGADFCSIYLNSGWEGSAVLHGQEFKVYLMDSNMNGRVDSDDAVCVRSGDTTTSMTDSCPPMRTLYWDGRGYTVDWVLEPRSGSGPWSAQATFAEWNPTTGTLRLEGKFIRRLTLSTETSQVILNSPGSEAVVPAGRYSRAMCFLADSKTTVTATGWRNVDFDVLAGQSFLYRIGGPLKNEVKAERDSGGLVFRHALRGIGGEIYQVGTGRSEPPPRFEVFKGDKLIASGSFEYG